ncbi:histidine phosphatase family protein [Streptomyces sp. NPDC005373]|uniref:histidine phosphatase family protein n=1 Tax=Streptomyces sp. NPDC005373 TaxID=3156879 RepID=UPI0033A26108
MTDRAPAPPVDALDEGLLKYADVTTVHLIRHAQQDYPRGGRPIGEVVDPPLSPIGERQVERVGERFAAVRLDAVYSSHLVRAFRTGDAVGRAHGLVPTVDKDLREFDIYRDLPPDRSPEESLGPEAVARARRAMAADLRWDSYPASETSAEFRVRVDAAIGRIVAAHPGGHIAVACHGGVINAFLAHHLGMRADMFFRAAHTSVTTVRVHGHRVVPESFNDRSHLSGDERLLTY